ncbi:MAG TPA: protein kinase, partial [Gemmatimonadaceae bacterium]
VLDFGLVKSVKQEAMGDSLATAVGRTPGTPAYMAPEMMLSEAIDGRADIYAVGCVAYYLLTGRLVFEAANTFQMIANHLRAEPVPPSVRAGVDIPRELESIVLKCLAKGPEDRYASVIELSSALAALNLKPWTQEEAATLWKTRQSVRAESSPAPRARGVLAPT